MRVLLAAAGSSCAVSGALAASPASSGSRRIGVDAWAPLRAGIDAWAALDFDADFAVNVGTAAGEQFLYSPDGFSMATELQGASLSKWPAAVMIAGLVNDGVMAFEDKASKYLPFWATDESDPRSRVTLESLLSFTSGYTADAAGVYQ